MFSDAVAFVANSIAACFDFLDRIVNAIPGSWQYIASFICMVIVTKLFITPLMGHMNLGSDRVLRNINKKDGK